MEENKDLFVDDDKVENLKGLDETCCGNDYCTEGPKSDEHWKQIDIARVNMDGKRTEGEYISSIVTAKSELIKSLKDVLGTMVQYPEYETDPNNIGKKSFTGYRQHPILEGEQRTKVISKLIDVINTL